MSCTGKVLAVCISDCVGVPKHEIQAGQLRANWGLVGDAHAGTWHRQVSLLGAESVAKVKACGIQVVHGSFAENIVTEGVVLYELPVGTRLRLGSALCELTQIGKECHTRCAIYALMGDCVMPREGVFVRVLQDGEVRAGDAIQILETVAGQPVSESAPSCC
jgi:MOSC domain-containing protein YiiM